MAVGRISPVPGLPAIESVSRKFLAIGTAARNILLGANMASLAFASQPRKMVDYVSESLFLYKGLSGKRGIPEKNVYQVLRSRECESVTLGYLTDPQDRTYFFNKPSYASDIVSLCLICQVLKPKVVFEIGTMEGYTALHFALNTPSDATIYTLDLPRHEESQLKLKTTMMDDEVRGDYARKHGYLFDNRGVASKVVCLFGDSASFDYSRFHRTVDFFFIDGAHSYEYVRSDTGNAFECCHPGSVIAWHDFGRVGINGVSKWLLELSREHEIWSVPGGSLAFMVVK